MKNETHALTLRAQQYSNRRRELAMIAIIFLIGVSLILSQLSFSKIGQSSSTSAAELRKTQSNNDAKNSLMSFEEELRSFFLNVPLV